jgi:hypothetical protein
MPPHRLPASASAGAAARSRNPAKTPHSINGSPHHVSIPEIDLVIARRFAGHREYEHFTHAIGPASHSKEVPLDFLFLTDNQPHQPAETFDRLRWGGQVVIVSRSRRAIEAATKAYQTWRSEQSDHHAWRIEHSLATERKYLFNLRFLGWRAPVYFMTARKIMLVPPGKSSDRFTYHVQLAKPEAGGSGFEVEKEIPTLERVLARLKEKFPDADEDTLRRRARKFTDKIFPVFLTREMAMLKLLQRDLPEKFRNRVPHLISAEKDSNGYTRRLRMNWLRNAKPVSGPFRHPLTQLEFAHQAAELLTALHDSAGIMHLDLRLDNVVITDHGVGFVDFGSAVRVGEAFPEASLLSSLFDEMMRTSQIQRMLGKMSEAGQVTSEEIRGSHQRIDKAVDFFYLAVQINNPLSNPDFRGLVEYDPASPEAHELSSLTERILRPDDPEKPEFASARDILNGIEDIEQRLKTR